MADDAAMTAPADDTAVQQPMPQPFISRLWAKVLQAKQLNLPRDQVDNYVRLHTNGRLNSVVDLTKAMATSARALSNAELSKGPPAALTNAAQIANAMALGLPEKTAPYGREGAQSFMDVLRAGREERPWQSLASETVGGAIPAALAGSAGAEVAEPWIGKLPLGALGKMMARGAAAGGVGGATGSYGSQKELTPNLPEMGASAAVGAATGAPLAIPAWWAATKLNPMEHILSRGIMESTPDITPSTGAGARALISGETTPMRVGNPAENLWHQPIPEEIAQRLPEPLRPMNFEKSPKLRTDASKYITQSPEAAAQAEVSIDNRIKRIRDGMHRVEQGYEPTLKRPVTDAEIAQMPPAVQRQLNALQNPTARDVFELYKGFRDRSQAVFAARDANMLTDVSKLGPAHEEQGVAQNLRGWLSGNVDGFDKLQQDVAPWLQREQEVLAARRQLIGRAIKPLGEKTQTPKGPLAEGVKELVGFSPQQISDRAARRLVKVYLSTDLKEMFEAAKHPELKEYIPDLIRSLPAAAGYGAGRAKQMAAPADATATGGILQE